MLNTDRYTNVQRSYFCSSPLQNHRHEHSFLAWITLISQLSGGDDAQTQVLHSQLARFGSIMSLKVEWRDNDFYQSFCRFQSEYSAAMAIITIDWQKVSNRHLRAYYASTDYCPVFLKGRQCTLARCNYAHFYNPLHLHRKGEVKQFDYHAISKEVLATNTTTLKTFRTYLEYCENNHQYRIKLNFNALHSLCMPTPIIIHQHPHYNQTHHHPSTQQPHPTTNYITPHATTITINDSTKKHFFYQEQQINHKQNKKKQVHSLKEEIIAKKEPNQWAYLKQSINIFVMKVQEGEEAIKMTKVQEFLQEQDRQLLALIYKWKERYPHNKDKKNQNNPKKNKEQQSKQNSLLKIKDKQEEETNISEEENEKYTGMQMKNVVLNFENNYDNTSQKVIFLLQQSTQTLLAQIHKYIQFENTLSF